MTRDDSGETLVEIAISVAVMGVGVVALLYGMGGAATTSGLHARQAAEVQGLRNYIQAVTDAPYHAECGPYVPAGYTDPAGYALTASVTSYAVGAGWTACASPSDPGTAGQGAQQVVVLVHQTDNRVRDETYTVVKRRPCTASASC